LKNLENYLAASKKALIQSVVGPLLLAIIDRTGETNPKISNATKSAILSLTQLPNVGPQFVASYILRKTKAAGWRPCVGRLDLLATMIPQFKFGDDDHQVSKDVRLLVITNLQV
jgi:hypothetical protein